MLEILIPCTYYLDAAYKMCVPVNNSVLVESTPQFIVVYRKRHPVSPFSAPLPAARRMEKTELYAPITPINRGVGSTGLCDTSSTDVFTVTNVW
jgi:hypothetical protein